ncbi:tetratricopeptide repeat protein [Solwaraspora sp. WMMD1047]|uniref:tetratricopeptide repeat protein n=1 Tax=Solwaraspora sp. WMMD1047 TaxID=3016102 RepID=UPI002417142F|nr:tetratricopeptide repeat protein [Solwaraspora sp. WMMD1047]MDG4834170.1 tetratricopeptide repeat protein [Solwaraspora sp. WMMD1047]
MGYVVWCGTPGGRDDAALVAIDDPHWTPVDGAVRWGKTVTRRPELRCESWGVPEVMQRAGHPVDTAQLTGTFNPGDRMVSDRYAIRLNGHPPATGEDGRSPWGGLSGAAVFCNGLRGNDLLVGVIAADPVPFGHSVLEAVPAYVLHRDPEFRAVLADHSPATVIEAAELTALASSEPAAHPQGAVVSPAELLSARRAVVGFRGRDDLLEQLRTWVQQPGVGVCLVHGAGGQGKTRLARHFGEQFIRDATGGIVLWLDRTAPAEELAVIADTVVPVLVVVDYAESRPSQVAALLAALATRRRPPAVKVLALARTAGNWWNQLDDTSDLVAMLLDAATVTALPVLDATDAARQDGYRAAVVAFAKELAHVSGYVDTNWLARATALADRPLPSAAAGWTVLAIQMTALADLLDTTTSGHTLRLRSAGYRPDHALAVASDGSEGDWVETTASGCGAERGRSPEERVRRHESRYWKSTAEAAGVFPDLSMSTLTDAVAATVLLLPPTPAQVNDWFARIPGLSDQPLDRRDRVRAWLAGLYPAAGPYAFGQLEPDRLAEHLIGTLIADRTRTSIAETLAAHVDGEDATRWVSICARAAAHPGLGDRVGELLTRMLGKRPTTLAVAALTVAPGLEAPKPLVHALECLMRDPATATASLTSVADALPKSSLLWADIAAELFDALNARSHPETPDESVMQGRRLEDPLGVDRIQFANEVTGLANEAAKAQGLRIEWSRSDVASNLAERASWLAELGRLEEALAASTEAVQMYRRLAEGPGCRPSRGEGRDVERLPGLARSLGNHSNLLMAVGRWREAFDAIKEVVQIFTRLVQERPDAFLSSYAGSLNNYSGMLMDSGRQEEALAASVEAVQIYRRLVEAGQEDLLPDFAVSLGNHARQLKDPVGRKGVLAETTEVVRKLRQLADACPDASLPDLAHSLNMLSNQLSAVGRQEEALAATTEVVQVYRKLANARPDVFLPKLAGNLHNVAMTLADSGRWRDRNGLDAITEAVTIRRQLANARPDAFRPDFARSLNDRAIWLAILRRREEALDVINEAVTIRRQLAEVLPAVYQRELEQSLHVLSMLQDESE